STEQQFNKSTNGRRRRRRSRRASPPMRWRSVADDEADAGGAAAADVQGGDALGAVDLVVASSAGHLLVRVENLAGAGCADRMAGADQATARVDRPLSAPLGRPRLPRPPPPPPACLPASGRWL